MRNAILAGLIIVAGCGGSDGGAMIGKSFIFKPNTDNGRTIVTPKSAGMDFTQSMEVEAFRGVILDQMPEEFYKGKLDAHARWVVKAEDGPAKGRVVTVWKPQVDLIPAQ